MGPRSQALAALPLAWRDWPLLAGVLMLAAGLRLAFFNGAFGSDDLVYLTRSAQIADGVWSSANYNGALRYGFNIPAGFFMHVFGVNMIAANLWPLLCSLTEIAAVYLLARALWTGPAALCAALILACMPLHVASATRIHADPVVACFLTLSFVAFYFAERTRARWLYCLTGVAMGLVFWSKELAVVTLFAFLFYPLAWRKAEPRWGYVVAGGLAMLLAHFALMRWIAGDPLHAFKVVLGQMNRSFIGGADPAEDGAWYYFRYLFVDIKHIWLAGVLAAWPVLGFALRRGPRRAGTAYVIFWLLALLGVLSFMPVSLSPLKLAMKQANYLTLFLAPLALLAGYLCATLPRRAGLPILFLTLAGGLMLAGLEQQAYRVFTSNSMAALDFAWRHPGPQIVGSNNNGNIAAIYAILDRDPSLAARFKYMSELPRHAGATVPVTSTDPAPFAPVAASTASTPVFALLDSETMGWGRGAVALDTPPPCWKALETLTPTGFGLSRSLLRMLERALDLSPNLIRERLKAPLEKLAHPRPARIYQADLADFWCERGNHVETEPR